MSDIQEPKSKRPAGWFFLLLTKIPIIDILNHFYWFVFITDTAFKQQRLPAWQPILTARNVMPIFFAIAAAFIPIGICLLYLTNLVRHTCLLVFMNRWLLILKFFRYKNFLLTTPSVYRQIISLVPK